MTPALVGNRCLCSACGQVFSNGGNFDRHRAGPWSARFCRHPAAVGLVLSPSGTWKRPGRPDASKIPAALDREAA